MVDFKELLRKYIDLVKSEEGISFLPVSSYFREDFTKEELEALVELNGPVPVYNPDAVLTRTPEYSEGLRKLLSRELHATKYETYEDFSKDDPRS